MFLGLFQHVQPIGAGNVSPVVRSQAQQSCAGGYGVDACFGLLEDGASDDQGEDKIILNGTDGSSTNANDGVLAEDYTSDIAVYSQAGTSTGSASVLNGVTVAASG